MQQQGGSTTPDPVRISVNGVEHAVAAEADTPLLYILRNDLKLKGAKYGCGIGECGACTVLLDGKPARSCDLPLWSVPGHQVTTIEALSVDGVPNVLQQAFIDEQALQCGYCINGMIMAATALLEQRPLPTEDEIREALARHLCRCGSQLRIVRAVQRAARRLAS